MSSSERNRDMQPVFNRICYRYRYFFLFLFALFIFQVVLISVFPLKNTWISRKADQVLPNIALPDKTEPQVQEEKEKIVVKDVDVKRSDASDPSMLFMPKCNIKSPDALSALGRANTGDCKQQIADVACLMEEEKLYPKDIFSTCHLKGEHPKGQFLGCYRDTNSQRDLSMVKILKTTNSPESCVNLCLTYGFKYAGLQYSHECWCGDKFGKHGQVQDALCDSKCPGDENNSCGGFFANKVYSTGLTEIDKSEPPLNVESNKDGEVKILYVMTLNGRQIRQIKRLLKRVYNIKHYYFIHVDKRQDYLYHELLPLTKTFSNIYMTENRFSTIWGGASLLQAHLSFMKEVLQERKEWDWDYYINLSESDYPVKQPEALEQYLVNNKGKIFLKSHGSTTDIFLRKQGLQKTFYECDNHLWRLGNRTLPNGVRYDGGSDWFALPRQFVDYVVHTQDEHVQGLKEFYKYTLLPAESFFHVVTLNSGFCDQFSNNNLHMTNWRRKQGCKCQYKHIVDWCGCSPNDYKPQDMARLNYYAGRPTFFARKFEAVVSNKIINMVEAEFLGVNLQDEIVATNYWQNEYHHNYNGTKIKDEYLTVYHSMVRLALNHLQSTGRCDLVPGSVLEATILHNADIFHALLVLFTAKDPHGNEFTMESKFQPQKFTIIKSHPGPIGRLINLEVGTDLDVKELIFRNYAQIMGPYSDLVLRHTWGPGPKFTISVAWIDPANIIAASYEVTVEDDGKVLSHNPHLSMPLRPGEWQVKIMYKWELVIEMRFLVVPLSFLNQAPIKDQDVFYSHAGPSGLYTSRDFKDLEDFLHVNSSKVYKDTAEERSKYTGNLLWNWIDSLVQTYWSWEGLCVVDEVACDLDLCKSVAWSSKYPDPKSEIQGIDEDTGKFL